MAIDAACAAAHPGPPALTHRFSSAAYEKTPALVVTGTTGAASRAKRRRFAALVRAITSWSRISVLTWLAAGPGGRAAGEVTERALAAASAASARTAGGRPGPLSANPSTVMYVSAPATTVIPAVTVVL